MRARVTVYPRPEILDPQGKAIHQALGRIGIEGVEKVRAGKSFEIDLSHQDPEEATKVLERICQKLLANTVVEDYEVELLPGGAG
ncbi:MAG: phosphoribosylformylglycinamidine synthase subunit PurS [Deltaproteobacteria bacterium]|nr:phosphoribosylformylglycinamidine synthase subunit PurS [Deltaproteobacteria bacterium]